MIIHEATGNDTGYYKCVARNEFETAQHAEQINVADGKCISKKLTKHLKSGATNFMFLSRRCVRTEHVRRQSGLRQLPADNQGQILHAQVVRHVLLSIVHAGWGAAALASGTIKKRSTKIRVNRRVAYNTHLMRHGLCLNSRRIKFVFVFVYHTDDSKANI